MSSAEAISVNPLATAKCSKSYGVSVKIVLVLRDVADGCGVSLCASLQFPFLLYCECKRVERKERGKGKGSKCMVQY